MVTPVDVNGDVDIAAGGDGDDDGGGDGDAVSGRADGEV